MIWNEMCTCCCDWCVCCGCFSSAFAMLTVVNDIGSDDDAVVCCCCDTGTAWDDKTDGLNWLAIEFENAWEMAGERLTVASDFKVPLRPSFLTAIATGIAPSLVFNAGGAGNPGPVGKGFTPACTMCWNSMNEKKTIELKRPYI